MTMQDALRRAMDNAKHAQEHGYAPSFLLNVSQEIVGTVEGVDWKDRTNAQGETIYDQAGRPVRFPIVTLNTHTPMSTTNQQGQPVQGTRWAIHLNSAIGTSNFQREVDNGGVIPGDEVGIMRMEDKPNPHGGNPMRVYAIGVVRGERPRAADPAPIAPNEAPATPQPTTPGPGAVVAPPTMTQDYAQPQTPAGVPMVQGADGNWYQVQGPAPEQPTTLPAGQEPF